jgi:hypothetical protein
VVVSIVPTLLSFSQNYMPGLYVVYRGYFDP